MKRVIIYYLVWIFTINLFGLAALNRVTLRPDTAYSWINPLKTPQIQTWSPLPMHAKWDSFWYLEIAQQGYHYGGGNQLSNIVFFPVYPLLIRFLSFIFLGNLILTGWVISLAALCGALLVFYKLIQKFHPSVDPIQAIIFLLIFPTAFFLNSVYTESLFLLLSLASFYFILDKKYFLAGIIGCVAALTRVTGILLLIPFLIEYFNQRSLKDVKADILSLFLIPLGAVSFLLFHLYKFGDLFLFFKVESSWGRNFQIQASRISITTHSALINMILDICFILFILVVSWYVYKQLRLSYAVYMLLTAVVALSSGTTMSIGRYILVLFPTYIMAASIKNITIKHTWAFISILLLATYTMLFVNYYWAG